MDEFKKHWKNLGYEKIQQTMIVKIEASLRRNLKGYPLAPGLSKS
jgi:hypothetical protein